MKRGNMNYRKHLYSIPLIILLLSCVNEKSESLDDKIYHISELDDAPIFVGGYEEFAKYIIYAIKDNPSDDFDSIQGKVYIDFIVDETGEVNYANVKTPVPKIVKKELESIVIKSPKWNPGKLKGIPVSTLQTIPIKF